ncbi:MAG: molybdate ABC transporter substrate-binding protein [Phycisphaerae bacterium]|nr:molybdate ABC transporter substrate-binding protein [Phycisphaerae bacterium]
MKNVKIWIGVVVLLVAVVSLIWYLQQNKSDENKDAVSQATPYQKESRFSTIQSDREIFIHCSNSMRLAMEEIAGEFQRRNKIAVVFNYGGGSELFPQVILAKRGDLFLCHDPYESKIKEKDLLVDSITIGHLKPVILVPKGNPKGIKGLSDLGQPNLRVASVDPRYATAGKMVHAVLDKESWGKAVKDNIVLETRGHSDAANALLTGHVDAAVVWSFLGAMYADRLDVVDCNVEFPQKIRVTLCRLKSAANPDDAVEMMKFTESDYAKNIWTKYGYRASKQD